MLWRFHICYLLKGVQKDSPRKILRRAEVKRHPVHFEFLISTTMEHTRTLCNFTQVSWEHGGINTSSNRFSCLLDLTGNANTNDRAEKPKSRYSMDETVQKELRRTEQIAISDTKTVYIKCLECQINHALSDNKAYSAKYSIM